MLKSWDSSSFRCQPPITPMSKNPSKNLPVKHSPFPVPASHDIHQPLSYASSTLTLSVIPSVFFFISSRNAETFEFASTKSKSTNTAEYSAKMSIVHEIIHPFSVPLPSAYPCGQVNTAQQIIQGFQDYMMEIVPHLGHLGHGLEHKRNNSVVEILANGHRLQIFVLKSISFYIAHL